MERFSALIARNTLRPKAAEVAFVLPPREGELAQAEIQLEKSLSGSKRGSRVCAMTRVMDVV